VRLVALALPGAGTEAPGQVGSASGARQYDAKLSLVTGTEFVAAAHLGPGAVAVRVTSGAAFVLHTALAIGTSLVSARLAFGTAAIRGAARHSSQAEQGQHARAERAPSAGERSGLLLDVLVTQVPS
jgi:methyl coenzyme M reductase alpha subunit